MPYLVAAVVLLGLLCVLNLLLTTAILRRMRTQAGSASRPAAPVKLTPGSRIGEFNVLTIDDEPVSHETVTGVVAFLSAGCSACHVLLPGLVERARRVGRENVLVVIGGDEPKTERTLAPVARVVRAELDGGLVGHAFQNTWTPLLYLVADQRVVDTAGRVEDLPDLHDRRLVHERAAEN